jgi:hypothetical protein
LRLVCGIYFVGVEVLASGTPGTARGYRIQNDVDIAQVLLFGIDYLSSKSGEALLMAQ